MKIDLGVTGAIEFTFEVAEVFFRGHGQLEVVLEAVGETICPYLSNNLTWIASSKTFLRSGENRRGKRVADIVAAGAIEGEGRWNA